MNATMQRSQALERANEIRTRRAELKREIKSGEVLISSVFQGPIPSWLRSEQIGRLLKAVPLVGESRAREVLQSVRLDGMRTIGNLTAHEKAALILRLRERRPGGAEI